MVIFHLYCILYCFETNSKESSLVSKLKYLGQMYRVLDTGAANGYHKTSGTNTLMCIKNLPATFQAYFDLECLIYI